MATLKTLISSFQRLSVELCKPRADQYRWGKAHEFLRRYSTLSNSLKNSRILMQRSEEQFKISCYACQTPFSPKPGIDWNHVRNLTSAWQEKPFDFTKIHNRKYVPKRRSKKNPLGDKPFAKGIILKIFVKKPRKPNSANRKCVLLRLSTGKEMTAYIPGEGHNLQEHNVVLVKVARLRDVPGVKLKCVRGAYDLGHVIKKSK